MSPTIRVFRKKIFKNKKLALWVSADISNLIFPRYSSILTFSPDNSFCSTLIEAFIRLISPYYLLTEFRLFLKICSSFIYQLFLHLQNLVIRIKEKKNIESVKIKFIMFYEV